MPTIEFVGQSRRDDDSRALTTARLINCYREPSESGWILKSVPGTDLVTGSSQVIATASALVGQVPYFTIGRRLFRLSQAGVLTEISTVEFDTNTVLAANNNFLVSSINGVYQVYNTTTSQYMTVQTGAFSDVGSVTFLGQRTFSSERNGRRFQWSNVAAPQTINGLNFASAESKDDNIVRISAVNGLLWLFGTTSVERWYLTNDTRVIAPVSGAVMEIGIKTFLAFTTSPNGATFVGSDNKVYQINGQDAQPISTTGVETSIVNGTITGCFYYQDEGHEFVCITFADRPAWCYDLSTAEWHERAEQAEDAWTVTTVVQAYGKFYAADNLGNISIFRQNFSDYNKPLRRTAISRTLTQEGKSFIVAKLELMTETGLTRPTEPNTETQLILKLSQDRGLNWGPPKPKPLGIQGQYDTRVIWRALGRFPSTLTASLSWSDPVNTPINTSVWIDIV